MSNEMTPNTRAWLAQRFGIAPESIVWHNSGICYDSIVVTTQEAADKVAAAVAGEYVNGGYLHGMELGAISKTADNFRVMC